MFRWTRAESETEAGRRVEAKKIHSPRLPLQVSISIFIIPATNHHHHNQDLAGGALGLHGWPAHPAFAGTPLPPAQPNLSAQTLNKITSQFWGFDPSRPPMPPHPLDSLSFPLSFPSLSSHLFKLPPADADNSRQMFRFRNSTWSNLSHYTHAKCLISLTICLIYNLYQVLVNFSSYQVIFHIYSVAPTASRRC